MRPAVTDEKPERRLHKSEKDDAKLKCPVKTKTDTMLEMHETLNKSPPDNCANEPTTVESCSRVMASMGVTLNDALEDGVMVANEELAGQL